MSNRPSSRPSSARKVGADRPGSRMPVWLWAVLAGILLAALGLAVLLAGDDTGDELVTGPVDVPSEALVGFDAASEDPSVGAQAPILEGRTFEDEAITIDPGDGPMVVLFLAHWCGHCQAEVPRVQAWLDENGTPDGVELVSVSTAADRTGGNYPPAAWLEDEGWTVPVMVDDEDGTAAGAYGLSGFPFFVAIGPDGEVVERLSGELSTDELEDLIEAARTGELAEIRAGGASAIG